jgi:hypothetical protein
MLSFLFLHVRVFPSMCDVVRVNAERREVRIRNHGRGDVDHSIVVMVRLSFLREVAKIINETVIQPDMCLRRDFISGRCQIRFRWKIQVTSFQQEELGTTSITTGRSDDMMTHT